MQLLVGQFTRQPTCEYANISSDLLAAIAVTRLGSSGTFSSFIEIHAALISRLHSLVQSTFFIALLAVTFFLAAIRFFGESSLFRQSRLSFELNLPFKQDSCGTCWENLVSRSRRIGLSSISLTSLLLEPVFRLARLFGRRNK